jgi:hypothetical protein
MAATDEQVQEAVQAWERGQGLSPRDWQGIGHSEGRDGAEIR